MFFKTKFPTGKYSELDPVHILSTLDEVKLRIDDTFPEAGLGRVAAELREVANCIITLVEELRKPLWSLRILTVTGIIGLIIFAVWLSILTISFSHTGKDGLMETLQGVESATNEVILLAIGIIFFATLENDFLSFLMYLIIFYQTPMIRRPRKYNSNWLERRSIVNLFRKE